MNADEKIYFSKIEFREDIGFGLHSILLINLIEGTLFYQTYKRKKRVKAPAITGIKTEYITGYKWDHEIKKPAVKMKNYRTNFKYMTIEDDPDILGVDFSYGYRFKENELEELKQYCNALEFEPYRNRKMSMDDEGYCGYRDEVRVSFTAITDSYIPMIKLRMGYYYDEAHI